MAEHTPISVGTDDGYIEGRFLIAAPSMQDPRFERAVIYICAHSEDGAMGLIINKPVEYISFPEMLGQLNIDTGDDVEQIRIRNGGPVETGRGFVLHSDDYSGPESTMDIDSGVGLTATVDILRAIATGTGPRRKLIALGYAGWAPGQLEAEIRANGWLICSADTDLLFDENDETKWIRAVGLLGFNPSLLSPTSGSA